MIGHLDRTDLLASWSAPFDAALDQLSHQRSLPETLEALLACTVQAFEVDDGYVHIDTDHLPVLVSCGVGVWSAEAPHDLEVLARRSGQVQVGPTGSVKPGHRHLVAPVPMGTDVVGSIGVAIPDGCATSVDGAADLLRRFAQLVAIACANAHLVSTERTARERQEALIEAGQALSSTLRLRGVLNRILTELQKVVPYDTASVQELDGEQMVIVGGKGIDMEVFDGAGFDVVGDGVPNAEVLRRCAPVIVPDILGDHPFYDFPHDAHEMSGVRGWLGVPLLFGERCIGMLTLDTYQPDFYTDDHARTALAFAAQAAIALQNARSFERTQREVAERRRAELELREAHTKLQVRMAEIEALQADLRERALRDDLTGLYNRRHLREIMAIEVEGSTRRVASVVLLDVDHFKSVNDTVGHDAGDRVLLAVADVLAAENRSGGVVCRYGGEEFVVLLPGVAHRDALARAERWRAAIEQGCVIGEVGRSITVSVGVATSPEHAVDADRLIGAADAAMYRAKASGRNRVVSAGSPDPGADAAVARHPGAMDDDAFDQLASDDAMPGLTGRAGDLPISALVAGEVRRTTPDATLYEVAALLTAESIGALVVDDGGDGEEEAIAVITERDIVRALAELADPGEAKVHSVASTDLVWCDAEATVAEVASLMAEKYLRHVLVERDGELLGIVSARDLLGVYAAAEDLDDGP